MTSKVDRIALAGCLPLALVVSILLLHARTQEKTPARN